MALPDHHITKDHFIAFGGIINSISESETLVDEIIVSLSSGDRYVTVALLRMVTTIRAKIEFLVGLIDAYNLSAEHTAQLKALLEGIKGSLALRNDVAHCGWKRGTRPGAIKPMTLKVKTKFKIGGMDASEKDYTAAELQAEAAARWKRGGDLLTLMNTIGLRVTPENGAE